MTLPQISDHELICRIGRGAYGEVWLARHATLGAMRAVKLVFRKEFDDERPYKREFEGLLKFEPISRSHPTQLAILHVGRDEAADCFYYVMELGDPVENPKSEIRNPKEDRSPKTEGGAERELLGTSGSGFLSDLDLRASDFYTPRTLRSELKARGRLPVSEAIELGRALATALEHLHRNGLVHRDIKPANIVYVGGVPKLADIGLITDASDSCSIVGTEGYIAPEGPGTPAADLYSLGKVLYEAVTGKDRRDYPTLPDDVRESGDANGIRELNAVILRACALQPQKRYSSATEVRSDLERLIRGGSVQRKRRVERFWGFARYGAAGLAVMACVAGLIVLAARQGQPTASPESSKQSTNNFAQTEYEIGRNYYRKAGNTDAAAEHYRNALKADPNFSLAEGGLATALGWGGRDRFIYSFPHLSEAAVHAERALRLDPHNSDALSLAGFYAFVREWDWAKADRNFQKAISFDPLNSQPHEWRGLFLRSIGRIKEAVAELEIAARLNGSEETVNNFFGQVLLSARRYPEAIQRFTKVLGMSEPDKTFMSRELAWALFWQGHSNDALDKWLDAYYGDEAFVPYLKRVLREQGQREFWKKRLDILRDRTKDSVILAEAASLAGRTDDALGYLDKAYLEHHDFLIWTLKTDPEWDSLRAEPRFKALLRKLKLD